jgi:hypothetical protein
MAECRPSVDPARLRGRRKGPSILPSRSLDRLHIAHVDVSPQERDRALHILDLKFLADVVLLGCDGAEMPYVFIYSNLMSTTYTRFQINGMLLS